MHIGCNGGSATVEVPPLFWWEGPDGSRVLTMYSGDYGTGLKPPGDWPYKTWLALIHTGDNHGPPTADEVKRLLQAGGPRSARREDSHGPAVRFQRCHPQGEPHAAGGAGRPGRHVDQGHHVDAHRDQAGPQRPPADRRLDALGTLLPAWGVRVPSNRDRGAAVATAYEGSLLFGEHTWGFDAKQLPRLYGKAWEQARAAGKYARPGRILGRKGRLHPQGRGR